jgi:hypothetical protein
LTQERFLRLLDNPNLLVSISYEEMKTLALAYPYSHNLRYLLALKARQDDHPDADRMLATAAAFSLDRRQLFYLTAVKIPVFQPTFVTMTETILELKPIEVVRQELESLAPQSRLKNVEKQAQQEQFALPPPVLSDTPSLAPDVANVPQFSQPFALWIGKFNPPVLEANTSKQDENPAIEAEEKPSQGLSAQELAERSVAENKDVISETLARLLVKQGYRDKAIDMYERLRLAFPDKSAYFAAEIEKLKK